MGLDTSHNAWHGPYSSFMAWRLLIAKEIGIKNLREMEGFGGIIPWDNYVLHPLYPLLSHPDCDGELHWTDCKAIADELRRIAPNINDEFYRAKTLQFAEGAELAYNNKENIDFH